MSDIKNLEGEYEKYNLFGFLIALRSFLTSLS